MPELYPRLLLWHKLVAMQTGGMALCSVKRKLNREEFKGWATMLRNVADEIDAFLCDGSFILDDKGQRMFPSTGEDGSGTTERAASRKAGGLRVATRKKQ